MKRWGVVLGLVVAVGALVWLALRVPSAPRAADHGDPANVAPPPSVVSAEERASLAEVATPPSSPSRVEHASIAATSTAGVEVSPFAPWFEVLVVDDATGEPVAGAEVAVSVESSWRRVFALPEAERVRVAQDEFLAARTFGWTTRTDRNGVARVSSEDPTVVHALHDGRYGRLYIHGTSLPVPFQHRLELHADRALRVRVRDAAGAPAVGVLLGAARCAPDGTVLRRSGAVIHETTAPDGIATI